MILQRIEGLSDVNKEAIYIDFINLIQITQNDCFDKRDPLYIKHLLVKKSIVKNKRYHVINEIFEFVRGKVKNILDQNQYNKFIKSSKDLLLNVNEFGHNDFDIIVNHNFIVVRNKNDKNKFPITKNININQLKLGDDW